MKLKKSLGQNFLKSSAVAKSIARAGQLGSNDLVLEIGPGNGILTRELLVSGAEVIAIEKDDRLIPIIEEKFKNEIADKKLRIIHGDILNFDVGRIVKNRSYKVVANIPYYITGALFKKFLENDFQPNMMVLLVQKEVAERIVARDGKESILSISVKVYGKPKVIARVSRKMFKPEPKVDSAVLTISDISKRYFEGTEEKEFFKLLHAGFLHKRKKLIRNLESIVDTKYLEEKFEKLSIDKNVRAENLSVNEWIAISENYIGNGKPGKLEP